MKFYYGWYLVGLVVVANMVVIGTTHHSFGIFVVPVSKDLGLSRADANTAFALLNIGMAMTATLVGRMADMFSIRKIMIWSTVALAGCLAVIGQTSSLLLGGAIMLLVLPVALQGAVTLSTAVLLSRWFVNQRGRVQTLGQMGVSFGSIVMPPVVGWLVVSTGWRNALLFCAAGLLVLLLPLFVTMRDRQRPGEVEPGDAAMAPPADQPAEKPAPIAVLLRMPAFWTIGMSFALTIGVAVTFAVSIVPIAIAAGIPPIQAATVASALGVGGFAGKVLIVAFADKMERIAALALMFAATALALLMVYVSSSYIALAGATALVGFMGGGKTPIYYAAIADRMGAASFGTALGLLAPFATVIIAVGARFAGEVYDRTGSYEAMLLSFAAVDLLAAGLMFSTRFLKAPKLPEPKLQGAHG